MGGLQSKSGGEEQMGPIASVQLRNDGGRGEGGLERTFGHRMDLLMGYT